MAINSTLKDICGLLNQRDTELQVAAIRVIGAIKVSEPSVIKSLGEMLVHSGNPNVRHSILDSFEINPHDQALKYLVQNLEKDETTHEKTLEVIARIGNKAIEQISQMQNKISDNIMRTLVTVLPRVKSPKAHQMYVESCFSSDTELVRNAVHALREHINSYNTREQGDLRDRLIKALDEKKLKNNTSTLSAIIISLGIIGQVQVKSRLLPFLDKKFPTQVRRHTLMSLARFEYAGSRHQDVFEAILPILDEKEYDELVRHAVHVISLIKPRRTDNNKIRALLENKHLGVKIYAIGALSQLDSITNVESILEYLHSPEIKIREAASEALRNMPSAVTVILRTIDHIKNKTEAFEMVKILEAHGNRIKPDKAKEMTEHMLELYKKGDEHYQLYKTALGHLRPEVLTSEICSIAKKFTAKKDWENVRDTLKILDHTPLLTPQIRYDLTVAKLKSSKKDLARSFRQSDYCLEHISAMLADDPKALRKKILADKILTMDELLYVGYHFSEQTNEERRFGIELLQHISKKSPKTQHGREAAKKLKVEGH